MGPFGIAAMRFGGLGARKFLRRPRGTQRLGKGIIYTEILQWGLRELGTLEVWVVFMFFVFNVLLLD